MGGFARVCAILAVVLVLGGAVNAASDDIAALAAEFRVLRTLRGHFSGGEWNDTVDRFGGRKHVVMQALGDALGEGTHTRLEVVEFLGRPDRVLARGDAMFGAAYRGGDKRVRDLLIFEWRGGHDFLYFASDGTRVLSHGWWAALE